MNWGGVGTHSSACISDLKLNPDPSSASQTMCSSMNPIMAQCFDKSELSDKKRPETVRGL